MKRFLFLFLCFISLFSVVDADYYSDSIARFVSSPSYSDLEKIEDANTRFCEETFLDAYRRRDFTDLENELCSDFFARKIEDEMNYIRNVLGERGVL